MINDFLPPPTLSIIDLWQNATFVYFEVSYKHRKSAEDKTLVTDTARLNLPHDPPDSLWGTYTTLVQAFSNKFYKEHNNKYRPHISSAPTYGGKLVFERTGVEGHGCMVSFPLRFRVYEGYKYISPTKTCNWCWYILGRDPIQDFETDSDDPAIMKCFKSVVQLKQKAPVDKKELKQTESSKKATAEAKQDLRITALEKEVAEIKKVLETIQQEHTSWKPLASNPAQ